MKTSKTGSLPVAQSSLFASPEPELLSSKIAGGTAQHRPAIYVAPVAVATLAEVLRPQPSRHIRSIQPLRVFGDAASFVARAASCVKANGTYLSDFA